MGVRIKSACIENLSQTENLVEDCDGDLTWDCVKEQFPSVGNRTFVERWTNTVMSLKARDSLPTQFYDHIQRLVQEAKTAQVLLLLLFVGGVANVTQRIKLTLG